MCGRDKCVIHRRTQMCRKVGWSRKSELGGCLSRWVASMLEGWLWVSKRHPHTHNQQATQVAVSQKPACVCCWPLHISTTLPQFVFCVLWPQMNFLPPLLFSTPPFKNPTPHCHHQTHTPSLKPIYPQIKCLIKYRHFSPRFLCCSANKECVWRHRSYVWDNKLWDTP